jgi:hypothetical protein
MTTGRDSSDRLSELAGRLAQLRTAESQDLGLISVAVGAIYAVKSAVKLGYSGLRSTRTQQVHVRKAAEALGRGGTPRTSVYLAGYYFNDSLLRLDIAYEGVLRRITREGGDARSDELIELAVTVPGIGREQFAEWRRIRKEVGGLKHRNPEQIERHRTGRGVDVKTVVSALMKLVSLIERCVPRRGA